MKQRIAEFIRELSAESIRVSNRHQADSVSSAYVDRAAENLATEKSAVWRRVVGGIGGLVAGVGFAIVGSMIQHNVYSTRGVLLGLVCVVVGLIAFVFHIIKE